MEQVSHHVRRGGDLACGRFCQGSDCCFLGEVCTSIVEIEWMEVQGCRQQGMTEGATL
jgi:hypothetical protein